jgi:diaminopimelate decarboxylase
MKTIECSEHGASQETFVCQHLVHGRDLGFHFFSDPGNSRPDAWCSNCEKIRAEHDGWNEESEKLTKIVLLCGGCYDRAKQLNE